MRNTGGEIVQVQGGHIIRSTAKKDRHSKVYTAKGPRDRRVRLAAHTAIQFYDVQDRLGYDRPSKAVDWLIKKAKSAIDKLDELPPWNPVLPDADADVNVGCSMERVAMETQQQSDSSGYGMSMNVTSEPHFTPTSLESFFPTTSASLSLNLQNYPHNMMSNSENKPQDLCLSLHSYQDPTRGHQTDQTLFVEPGSGSWADQQQGEMGRFSRMMGWNDESRGGYMFNNPPVYGSGQDGSDFSQRGTLQSSFVSSVHAWNNHDEHDIHRNSATNDHRFVPEGFSGFCVPARGYGNGELDNRHSSDSPHSHH